MRTEKISLEQRVSDLNVGAQSFKDEIRLLEAELRKLKQRERDNEEVSIEQYINPSPVIIIKTIITTTLCIDIMHFLYVVGLCFLYYTYAVYIFIDHRRSDQRVGNISP